MKTQKNIKGPQLGKRPQRYTFFTYGVCGETVTRRCRDAPWHVSTAQNINLYFIDIQYITSPATKLNPSFHPRFPYHLSFM